MAFLALFFLPKILFNSPVCINGRCAVKDHLLANGLSAINPVVFGVLALVNQIKFGSAPCVAASHLSGKGTLNSLIVEKD
jgi:hypothetical protein